ncbi:hypothetical protein [Marivita cryptomonadis]
MPTAVLALESGRDAAVFVAGEVHGMAQQMDDTVGTRVWGKAASMA